MRTIKFRGKCAKDSRYAGEWVDGGVLQCKKSDDVLIVNAITDTCSCTYHVDPATVGQFTGLHDKHGKEVYEGDIIAFYELKTYCINPDCEPYLLGYSERLHKKIKAVRFEDGMFGVESEYLPIDSFAYLGDWAADEDYMEELKKDPYFDDNGYDLDDVIGFEVIGNVFDNPDLIEKGGEQ